MGNNLIKIEKRGDNECVSARELYSGLNNGNVSDYARWSKRNIVNNIFFEENKDWTFIQPSAELNRNRGVS